MFVFLSACAHNSNIPDKNSSNYYKVKTGETLESIAVTLDVPYDLLRRSNIWLDPARIKADMKLMLPSDSDVQRYQAEIHYARQQQENILGHIWPLKNISVSSPYGPRNGRMHKGIDLRAPHGTPIFATANGTVTFSGVNGGYGKLVVIDHGHGIHTAYAHNTQNLVNKGQAVIQGETIAKVGMSGKASGNHVHYELRTNGKAINPSQAVQAGL